MVPTNPHLGSAGGPSRFRVRATLVTIFCSRPASVLSSVTRAVTSRAVTPGSLMSPAATAVDQGTGSTTRWISTVVRSWRSPREVQPGIVGTGGVGPDDTEKTAHLDRSSDGISPTTRGSFVMADSAWT